MDPHELDEAAKLVDFLQLYRADAERGDPRDPAEYARRVHGDPERLAREYEALEAARHGRDGSTPGAGEEPSDPERPALPGYRLLRELGRGGQGAVYLAEDLELSRLVALKVLRLPLGVPSTARRARMRREVNILARLDHPGICAVYRAHLEHEPPFVAMRYVPGPTLAELLAIAPASRDAGRQPPQTRDLPGCVPADRAELERLLAFFEDAARALHVAHEAGVVHRDVKPANIVAATDGRPVLLDFGLARTLDAEQTLVTRTDEVFGTPAYMSPEQLTQPAEALDRRTDVHSLGVTLFEVLTGRRPFEAPSQRQLEQAICTQPVPRASQLNLVVPADLDVVLATAMEKDLGRRYATARDLAEELRRVREHHPVLARPTGRLLRARRWSQRHPALAVAIGLLALGACGLSIALVLLAREGRRTRDALNASRSQNLAFTSLDMLHLDPISALDEALEAHEMAPGAHSRGALYAALPAQRCQSEILFAGTAVRFGVVAERGLFAVAISGGTVACYRLPEGALLCAGTVPGNPTALMPTPDGADVIVGSADGTLVSLVGRQPWTDLCAAAHAGAVRSIAFSPDGSSLATAGDDGMLLLRDVRTGRVRRLASSHRGVNSGLRFSPDGHWIVSWGGDLPDAAGRIDTVPLLFDVQLGALAGELTGHERHIEDVRFSPDGRHLASASDEGRVRIWDLPGVICDEELSLPGKVHDLNFDPTGTRLAVAFDPEQRGISIASGAWVFDVRDGTRRLDLRGHDARAVASIDWSPDGERLLTGGFDGTARLWHAGDGRQLDLVPGRHSLGLVSDARFLPGGDEAVICQGEEVLIASSRGPQGPLHLVAHDAPVTRAAFSQRGDRLASVDLAGVALVHDVRSGRLRARLPVADSPLTDVAFSVDGSRLVAGGADGSCQVLDLDGSARRLEVPVGNEPAALLRVLSGDRLVAASGPEAALFDLSSGRRLRTLRGHEADIQCLDVSPDERLIATGAADRTARLWNLSSSDDPIVLREFNPGRVSDNRIFACRFSPDGKFLATAADDGCIRTYRVPEGRLMWTRGPQVRVGALVWLDGDEQLALMPKWNGGVAIQPDVFAGGQGPPVYLEPRPGGRSTAMAASPDGTRLLVSATDGRTQLWDLRDHTAWAAVGGGTVPVTDAAFCPDGSCFVTASADGAVTLWPTDPEGAARAACPKRIRMPSAHALAESAVSR
jgi:eukaryotic-like serine/threonine-protein kinase